MRFKKRYPKSNEIATRIQNFFKEEKLEELARESEFVKKDGEINGKNFTQLCIAGITEKGLMCTLNELCVLAMKLDAQLCTQSLNERFNSKGEKFLKMLFEKALENRFEESVLETLQEFSQIILEDSTVTKLPEHLENIFKGCGGKSSKAALKIDYTYDFKSSNFTMRLLQGKDTDNGMQLPDFIPPKSLWLRDLGYFRISDFEKINEAEAFYVSRLKYNVKVYLSPEKDAPALDLLTVLDKMKENEVKDIKVYLGAKNKMLTRLILQKVPKELADKKRKELRNSKNQKGKKVSKNRLKFCNCSAYITNLGEEQWNPYQVMKLYKVRWQIEILFKVWKSVLKIGKVQKMKAHRFMCLLYGQLIWAIINMRIFQAFKNYFWNEFQIEISELKTYKIMQSFNNDLTKAIYQNSKILYEQCLDDLYSAIFRFGKKQYKKGKPNPVFHIENILT